MPKFVACRGISGHHSPAQKKQTSAASQAASSLHNENIAPKAHSPALRVKGKPILQANTLNNDPSLIKSLKNKVYYNRKTLQISRQENSALLEEQQSMRSSLTTSLSCLSTSANELSGAKLGLAGAQEDLFNCQQQISHMVTTSKQAMEALELSSQQQSSELLQLKAQDTKLRNRLKTAQKELKRTRAALALAIRKDQRRHVQLKKGGLYTPNARALARTLVLAGCAQKAVGIVIKDVAQLLNVEVVDSMSKRSVRRALIEGSVAASIQVGHAIVSSPSITFSDDATSHRHITYESRHIAIRRNAAEPPQIFFVGVDAATDHTSNTQFEGWMCKIQHIAKTYSQSPFAKRLGIPLLESDVALKLKGTSGDHASDQKKKHSMLFQWKIDVTKQALGSRELLQMSHIQLLDTLGTSLDVMKTAVGEPGVWEQLTMEEQEVLEARLMKDVSFQIGKDAYVKLSESQKHELELFFRGGCCMHKDLNAVKGGDKEMCAMWKDLDTPAPIFLANKDNTAVLNDPEQGGSQALQRAKDISGRGGAKATSLAGMILNHKDKKKGQQDTFRWYFFAILGYSITFPDTSNTRYGSHCEAAAELVVHLPLYLEFLDFIRDRKDKAILTNIENNLCKALRCPATLTELCVLAAYGQMISIPYMTVVRGPGSLSAGALDLSPIHVKVIRHIGILVDNPYLFVAVDSTPNQSSLDENQWTRNDVFYAIKALAPSLPFFQLALRTFLLGALSTWTRFSAEYLPGGEFANTTPADRALAYIPPTNDRNEGALGAKRQDSRHRPNHSGISYNSIAALKCNGTETFIATKLNTDDDGVYLRKLARELDSSMLETEQKKSQAAYDKCVVAEKRHKAEEKRTREQMLQKTLDGIPLTSDLTILHRESKAALELRLKKYRYIIYSVYKVGKSEFIIPVQSKITRQESRVSHILLCHEKYISLLSVPSASDSRACNLDCEADELGADELHSDHEMDCI